MGPGDLSRRIEPVDAGAAGKYISSTVSEEAKIGAFFDVDHTLIDVNSGRATRERNIEETALRTNIEAAEEIARQAANLYDKFVGFTEDLIKLGGQMRTATKTYEESMKKLTDGTGNLTRRVENLKKLGVNPSKQIDNRLIDKSEDSED